MTNGIAIGLSLLAGVALGGTALFLVLPFVLILTLLRGQGNRVILVVVTACVVIGIARGSRTADMVAPDVLDQSTAAVGVISSIPIAGGEFERTSLRLERIRLADDSWEDASGSIIVFLPDQRDGLSLHDRVTVYWDATAVSRLTPGYGSFVRTQGASGSAWVWSYQLEAHGPGVFEWLSNGRRQISDALTNFLPGDAGALASGIVTGDDSALSGEMEEAFRKTGTAHVTAVSGQNVALLIGFLAMWMRPAGGARRLVVHGVMVLSVWVYATMVGLEAPALRAATVATLTIAGTYAGRRPDPLTLLALTLGGMALLDPTTPRTIGFWLSASASWALCTVVRPEAPTGIRRRLLNLAMGPLAATLATLPILIATFSEWSPVAPIANAVLGPIMTLMFGVTYGFTVIALIPGPWASLIAWLPGIGLDLALSVVQRMASVAPRVHLDGIGGGALVMIALPCVLLLMVMGRDLDRWLRILRRV